MTKGYMFYVRRKILERNSLLVLECSVEVDLRVLVQYDGSRFGTLWESADCGGQQQRGKYQCNLQTYVRCRFVKIAKDFEKKKSQVLTCILEYLTVLQYRMMMLY